MHLQKRIDLPSKEDGFFSLVPDQHRFGSAQDKTEFTNCGFKFARIRFSVRFLRAGVFRFDFCVDFANLG